MAGQEVEALGGGVIAQELQGSDARIRNDDGAVRVQSRVGAYLELGDVSGLGMRVEDGGLARHAPVRGQIVCSLRRIFFTSSS